MLQCYSEQWLKRQPAPKAPVSVLIDDFPVSVMILHITTPTTSSSGLQGVGEMPPPLGLELWTSGPTVQGGDTPDKGNSRCSVHLAVSVHNRKAAMGQAKDVLLVWG